MTFRGQLQVTALKGESLISRGYTRVYEQCKTCERIYTRDYVPFSLSNPILTLPCGHGSGVRHYERVRCVGSRTWNGKKQS